MNDQTRLDAALQELGADHVEAPEELRASVMAVVNTRAARRPRVVHGRFGGAMTKKAMIGLAAAAAVILAALVITGFPPDLGGTQGAIGQAARYNSEQITERSAQVGDPAVQTFIQSETFAAILADKNAVKLLSNSDFRRELLNADVRRTLSSPAFADAIAGFQESAALRKELAFDFSDLAAQFRDGTLATWLDNAELRKHLVDAAFVADLQKVEMAGTVELRQLEADLAKQLNADLAAEMIGRRELTAMLGNAALAQMFGDVAFAQALKSPGFAQALSNPAFLSAMFSQEFAQALNSPAFETALTDATFAQALSANQFAQALEAGLRKQ